MKSRQMMKWTTKIYKHQLFNTNICYRELALTNKIYFHYSWTFPTMPLLSSTVYINIRVRYKRITQVGTMGTKGKDVVLDIN